MPLGVEVLRHIPPGLIHDFVGRFRNMESIMNDIGLVHRLPATGDGSPVLEFGKARLETVQTRVTSARMLDLLIPQ